MKKIALVLCFALAVSLALAACASSDRKKPDDPSGNGGKEPENPNPDGGNEGEKEPEEKPAPLAPAKVLSAFTTETAMTVTTVSKQRVVKDTTLADLTSAFVNAGYDVLDTTPVPGTKIGTKILSGVDWLVTLIEDAGGTLYCVEERKSLLSTDPLFKPKDAVSGEVLMVQVGTERGESPDNPMIGMCYVYRLGDGSAFIVDGGSENDICAQRIFETLEKLNVAKDESGKYRIACWFFSHGHGDHIGAFKHFASLYADKTDVQYVMYSTPSAATGIAVDAALSEMDVAVKTYPNAKRVCSHAGLQYYFGNLTVNELYNPELLYQTAGKVTYYNDTSVIIRVEANGKSVFHMGDGGEAASAETIYENEASALKSDILQITHHGLYTGNNSHNWSNMRQLYTSIGAQFGVVPMGSRNPNDKRNGRFTVLVDWGVKSGYQISFVENSSDNHGKSSIDQAYFDQFCADVAAGTATQKTLYGYDGINTLTNAKGMVTYMSGSETSPMVTVFSLASTGVSVVENTTLTEWLGK